MRQFAVILALFAIAAFFGSVLWRLYIGPGQPLGPDARPRF